MATVLNMKESGIEDLSKIKNKKQLEIIECIDMGIRNMCVFNNLVELKCSYNKIRDIPTMPKLKRLYCDHNEGVIIQFQPELRVLSVVTTRRIKLPISKKLPKLKSLSCGSVATVPAYKLLKILSTYSPDRIMKILPSLKHLNTRSGMRTFPNPNITPNLQSVTCASFAMTDVQNRYMFMRAMPEVSATDLTHTVTCLTQLTCQDLELSGFDLSMAVNLISLQFKNCSISGLTGVTHVRELRLIGCGDMRTLPELEAVEMLCVIRCPVTAITIHPELNQLILMSCTMLETLPCLQNVTNLTVTGCPITEVPTGLALQFLNCDNCLIQSIHDQPELLVLSCSDNLVTHMGIMPKIVSCIM
jgi:Leucine-rich repeat (LRR) protein